MFNQQQIFLFGQIQTTQTGGQLYSETYPYEVSECSLLWSTVWPSKGQTIVLAFKNLTYFSWEKIDCVKAFTNGSLHKQQLKQEGGDSRKHFSRLHKIRFDSSNICDQIELLKVLLNRFQGTTSSSWTRRPSSSRRRRATAATSDRVRSAKVTS